MNRLFSGIRAAVSFGRAAPKQVQGLPPAPQPAAPNSGARAFAELAALQEQMRVSHQERQRAEADSFERDCKRAQALLGDRPEAAAFLDLLRFCGATPKTSWDAVLKTLRAEPDARRGCYFDHLTALKAALGWTVTQSQYGIRRADTPLGMICELLIRDLIAIGFEMHAGRASEVLRILAAGESGHVLKGRGFANDLKLGAVRDIEKALKKGLAIGAADREAAKTVVAIMHDTGPNRRQYGPEKADAVLVRQLKAIAGTAQQDTFFARMCTHKAAPLFGDPYVARTKEQDEFWFDTVIEAAGMIGAFRRYSENRDKAAPWLLSPASFEAEFGPGDGDKAFRFGWWARNTAGEEGFDKNANNYVSRLIAEGPAADWPEVFTRERLLELQKLGPSFTHDWPPTYAGPAVPHVEAFAFGGHDPEGALFNLWEKTGDGNPGPGWFKSVDAVLARVGKDRVGEVLKRWIADFVSPDLAAIDPQTYGEIELLSHPFRYGSKHYLPADPPARGTADYARQVRVAALKVVCGVPGLAIRRQFKPLEGRRAGGISDNNIIVARGIAFTLSRYPAAFAAPLLEGLALRTLGRTGAACAQALGELRFDGALALGRIRRAIRDKTALNTIDRVLSAMGGKLGLSADDMHEIAMADWGISENGVRSERLGDLTAELRVTSSRKAELRTIDQKGKVTRGISKAFKELEGGTNIAAELEEAASDIAVILPEARRRIEAAWRTGRKWDYAGWKERLVGNGLLRTLAERLIWCFTNSDGSSFVAIPQGGRLLACDGTEHAAPDASASVELWHPMDASADEVAGWRRFLVDRRLTQPFSQAWRPIYPVTEAERATATYSNRFAGHILEQAPVMGILKKRGWVAFNRTMTGNSQEHERVRLLLPHFGVAAEYWVAGIGTRIQEGKAADAGGLLFAFITTDRVCFYPLDSKSGKPGDEPMPVDAVHPHAFGEVMYDIDSVVGRTSIGADRFWHDRGQGAPHLQSEEVAFTEYRERYASGQTSELGKSRHAFLEAILPGLSIADQCTLTPQFLMVDGKRHTYKISLNSGNILIAPNDRYLCIVKAGETGTRESYVPFEGDDILSIILSKAMMLAADDRIEDPTILAQLNAARTN